MSEWRFIELRDAIEKANTGLDAIKRAPIVEEDTGIKCLRITDVSQNNEYSKWGFTKVEDKNLKKFCLIKNDIIVARTGNTIGVNLFVNEDLNSVFNNGLIRLKVKEEYDPKFIYYLLQTCFYKRFINSIAYGTSTQPNMQIDSFLSFEIPDIPNRIQKEIAKTLSILDKKITLLRQQNHDLEELAQVLFKRWFVEFEFPNENGKPYKSSGGKMVESELGEIPEGWRVGSLVEIITNYDSKRIPLSSNERAERKGKYPYHGATSIMDYVDDYIFDGRYLLLGEDGSVIDDKGFPFLQYVEGKIWVNNHAHVLEGKYPFSTDFIYLLLRKTKVNNIVTGAVQLKINQTNLNSLEVLIPNSEIVETFNDAVKGIFDKYFLNKQKILTTTKLRDTLLPKLMSGELRVKM